MRNASLLRFLLLGLLSLCGIAAAAGQVPTVINYQGRMVVDGVNFSGDGQFKFAFVNATGSETYWSHDNSSAVGAEPSTHVVLPVSSGLYAVLLGDAKVKISTGPSMQSITPAALNHSEVYLRIWFKAGTTSFQQLVPDQRIAAVAYALMADSVPDGSITTAKLAAGSVTTAILAPGAVTADKLASSASGGNLLASMLENDTDMLADGFVRVRSIPAKIWETSVASGAPNARLLHSSVWTGNDMIVWGGKVGSSLSSQGGTYNAKTKSWTLLPTSDASPARSHHTAVWTGDRMIVWGGFLEDGSTQTGALYAPTVPDSSPPIGGWLSTSTTAAPTARTGHSAVWTDSKMLIWGGRNSGGVLGTGGAFTPPSGALVPGVEGSWSSLSNTNAPAARHGHTAVWTGSKMLVWGGLDMNFQAIGTGATYDPANNTWTALSNTGAPSARTGHSAVWTGSKMLIFGGTNAEVPGSASNLSGDGAAFDPVVGTWSPLAATDAPSGRHAHSAVWTGSEMLILAGETLGGQIAQTGAAYNAVTDTWRAMATSTLGSSGQTQAWTGSELLVFGSNGLQTLGTAPAVYLYTAGDVSTAEAASRTLGQQDVTASPSVYDLHTSTELAEATAAARTIVNVSARVNLGAGRDRNSRLRRSR